MWTKNWLGLKINYKKEYGSSLPPIGCKREHFRLVCLCCKYVWRLANNGMEHTILFQIGRGLAGHTAQPPIHRRSCCRHIPDRLVTKWSGVREHHLPVWSSSAHHDLSLQIDVPQNNNFKKCTLGPRNTTSRSSPKRSWPIWKMASGTKLYIAVLFGNNLHYIEGQLNKSVVYAYTGVLWQ